MKPRGFGWKLVLTAVLFLGLPSFVLAADFKLSPTTGSYQVGDSFSMTVQLSSVAQAANAVYGAISFPTNRLQVTSVSKTGSIVNLWVQEPNYSNISGQVIFEGAILNPGFTGSAGRLVTINFKAKTAGTATVSFSDGSILANDGLGTSIINGMGKATFSIAERSEEEPEVKKPIEKPVEKPKATTTASTDTEPPVLEVNEVKVQDSTRTRFVYSATDKESGLDHYEFQIDNGIIQVISADGHNVFDTESLKTGAHVFTAVAIDKAGNRTKKQINFEITAPACNSPLINWGGSFVAILSILVPLISLLFLLAVIVILGWWQVSKLKKKLLHEVDDAEDNLHKAFDLIRDDLQKQVRLLEKAKNRRKLTSAEAKLLRTIKGDLNEAEKFIKKEIEDIEKQIK